MMMKKSIFTFLLMSLFAFSLAHAELTPDELLKKADDIRNPSDSFQMKVSVQSTGETDRSEFEVFLKGKNKTLVKTLLPRRDRGRNMLMIDENMWVFIPNLKREVRISLAQKLTGQTANGDISRMRWHGDYEAQLVKKEGTNLQLALSAKKKGLTYDKMNLWVDKKTGRPEKAEYLTVTGKKLKEAFFQDYKEIAGGIRPTKIVINDAVKKEDSSILMITDMMTKDFPDSLFVRENLQ